MTTLGYALSCEDFRPDELTRQVSRAQQAGFEALWISDHFHPWTDRQGQSPFVWWVIAQAAATSAALLDDRFTLGVGTGEALNEHIALPGELGQNLPTPVHFEQASSLVTTVEQSVPAGPDAEPHLDRIGAFADAGFDEVCIQQIGPNQDSFFDFWESEVAPELAVSA